MVGVDEPISKKKKDTTRIPRLQETTDTLERERERARSKMVDRANPFIVIIPMLLECCNE